MAFDVVGPIRAMQESDLPAVLEIEHAAQLTPWTRNHFLDCLGNDHYLCQVVEAAGQPVAFLISSRILDETHVLNIAVAPARQRQGLARGLLEQAIQVAQQDAMSVIYLEVRESNKSARALYESLGFTVSGIRKNYYRRGDDHDGHEDAVLMQCLLASGHK